MHTPLTSISGMTTRLRSLYYHWLTACDGDLPPRLSEIDLHRVNNGMDCLVLTEILRDAHCKAIDFQFVYIGKTIGAALSQDMAGRSLSTLRDKGPETQIWNAYCAIAADPTPHIVQLPYVGPDPTYKQTLELFLPLRDDHDTPRYVLVGVELLAADSPSGTAQSQPC